MRSRAHISVPKKEAATLRIQPSHQKRCGGSQRRRVLQNTHLVEATNTPVDTEALLVRLREMEDALTAAVMEFGASSTEVKQICESTVKQMNGAATVLMRRHKMREAHEMLKKAEMLTTSKFLMHTDDVVRIYLRSTTLNNLACYWLRRGSPRGAMKLLNQALALEVSKKENASGLSDCEITYMNMCVALSKLGRHREALACINSAITGLLKRKEVHRAFLTLADLQDRHFYRRVMSSAYHNLATEHEHLKQPDKARQAFRCADLWSKTKDDTSKEVRKPWDRCP
ncbi:hypothetical protein BSKO_05743 [Bryopsis sp. KO-2023]|nr:hypothetical protein BSKO_05743 [Bryopsis sp. KO-2023]